MGIALRNKIFLGLNLARSVWKMFCMIPLNLSDLAAIDTQTVRLFMRMRDFHNDERVSSRYHTVLYTLQCIEREMTCDSSRPTIDVM